MKNLIVRFVIKFFFITLVFSSPAYAYIDGGSALMLLQGIFSAIGAVLIFMKKPRQLIAKLFRRK